MHCQNKVSIYDKRAIKGGRELIAKDQHFVEFVDICIRV